MRHRGIAAQYSRHLRRQFGFWPTWLPDAHVAVGDFGQIQQGVFMREGHASDLSVSYPLVNLQAYSDQVFASEGVRHAMVDGEASAQVAEGRAGARIEFGRALGVFVGLRNCREERVSDMISLAAQLDGCRQAGHWSDAQCLVTGVVKADSALIAVSSKSGGVLDIAATVPSPNILALLRGDVHIASEFGVAYRSLVTAGCTPLLRLSRLSSHGELIVRGSGATAPRLLGLDPQAGLASELPVERPGHAHRARRA